MLKNYKLKQALIHSTFLGIVLITVYMYSYSGTFTTDDEHILASRTISMAFDGSINDYRVLGNSRIFSYFNLDPDYGQQSLNIEPMQAILGSQLAKLANRFHLGIIQTIFFLNILLTALTAQTIFWILLLLGFKLRTSIVAGFLFGVCTIAWPYAKTFFRDPVAMLFVTVAWGSALILISKRSQIKSNRIIQSILWVLLVSSLLFGILSKNTTLLIIPVFIIMFYQHLREIRLRTPVYNNKSYKIIISIIILILISAVAIWFFAPKQAGVYSRFTAFYYSSVLNNIINNNHSSFIEGILGPIFSPGKSFFLYSPVLILAFFSLIRYFKKSYPAWLFLIILIIVQALYYDSIWWGSVNWGLRFLLPAVPILIISSGQIIEDVLARKIKFPLLLLVFISFIIQVIGVWIPTRNYYVFMAKLAKETSQFSMIWNPRFSQLWWNFTQIMSGESPNFAAWRVGVQILPIILLIFFTIVLCIYLYKKINKSIFLILGSILVITMLGNLILQLRNDPAYSPQINLIQSQNIIKENYSPGDTIFVQNYGSSTWLYWMNWSDPSLKWISLSPINSVTNEMNIHPNLSVLFTGANISDDSPIQELLTQIAETSKQVWIVTSDDSNYSDIQIEALGNLLKFEVNKEWDFTNNELTTNLILLKHPRQ
jgi:hypothetical protein